MDCAAAAMTAAASMAEKSRTSATAKETRKGSLNIEPCIGGEAQITTLSQLWSWITITKAPGADSKGTSFSSSNDATDEKTATTRGSRPGRDADLLEIPRVKEVEGRAAGREPRWKYKCSTPSRGTHRDYDGNADALWTGGGKRAVPEGLRKMAAGETGGGAKDEQVGGSGSGNGDHKGDDGDDESDGDGYRDEDKKSLQHAMSLREEERAPLEYRSVQSRRRPKRKHDLRPYREEMTRWERWKTALQVLGI